GRAYQKGNRKRVQPSTPLSMNATPTWAAPFITTTACASTKPANRESASECAVAGLFGRDPPIPTPAGLRIGSRFDAGARDRGEHRGVFCRQCCVVSSFAVHGSRAASVDHVRTSRQSRDAIYLA